jgi:hypothetical protein
VALFMGSKMDLPTDDALEIEEMWVLRICAWNVEIGRKDHSSAVSSSKVDEGPNSDESQNSSGERIVEHVKGGGEAGDGTLNQEEEDLWSDVEDETGAGIALILIPY